MLPPPLLNCFLYSITNSVDDNGYPKNQFELKPHDFGGNESVLEIIHIPKIKKFYNMFTNLLKYSFRRGYTIRRDIYSAPYDFRNVPVFPGTFFENLTKLVETAYEKEKKKVDLFGFSQGCYVIHNFLTERTTKEWRRKYINQVVFLAPSLSGSTSIFYEFWTKKFAFAPFLNKMNLVKKFMMSWPGFHIHFPNTEIFKDEILIFGPNSEEYKARDLLPAMIARHIISDEYVRMAQISWDRYVTNYPKELDEEIPVHLFYNDGVPTRYQLNFSKGWDKLPTIIYNEGDGTIPAIGPRSLCSNWKHVKCYNFNINSDRYDHDGIIDNPFVFEQVFNALDGFPVNTFPPEKNSTISTEL